MTLIEKLKKLGFKDSNNNYNKEDLCFMIERHKKDRFKYDLVYSVKQNTMFIFAYKSDLKLIEEKELLRNHNNLATGAKNKYLEIKEALKEFNYEIYEG